MESITLPESGRRTTRLGFGCSGLIGGVGGAHSSRLLEEAYDAGVRHFDVAPMYGFGTAESLLGGFLQGHPDATVTTKYGVLPEHRSGAEIFLRSLAKQVLAHVVKRKPLLPRPPSTGIPARQKAPFTAQAAEASLHRSLRALKRDHIDLLLLHEATAQDLSDERLLEWLDRCVQAGHIGAFGVGSPSAALPELVEQRSPYCDVLQSEWSVSDAALPDEGRFRITHRTIQSAASLRAWLTADLDRLQDWSQYMAVDLKQDDIWPSLLLQTALCVNRQSIVLFSSRSVKRVRDNVAGAQDMKLARAGLLLHTRLRSLECNAIP